MTLIYSFLSFYPARLHHRRRLSFPITERGFFISSPVVYAETWMCASRPTTSTSETPNAFEVGGRVRHSEPKE